MGSDKATLIVGGMPLADRVAHAMEAVGVLSPFTVGAESLESSTTASSSLPNVADRWPLEGPLGGLVTALGAPEVGAETHILVLAVDLPYLTPHALAAFVAECHDRSSGAPETSFLAERESGLALPCGLWSTGRRAGLEASFSSGERSVRRSLSAVSFQAISVGEEFRDADDPGDMP